MAPGLEGPSSVWLLLLGWKSGLLALQSEAWSQVPGPPGAALLPVRAGCDQRLASSASRVPGPRVKAAVVGVRRSWLHFPPFLDGTAPVGD